MRILILIDAITIPHLKNGLPPTAPYSHDKNLFQFGHECLRRGYKVILTAAQEDAHTRSYYEIGQIYPTWEQKEAAITYNEVAPDIVVSVFPEALNIRHIFPHPKIVAINAAVHWLESPERFPAQYIHDLITAARYNIDFMITQNERMKEILQTIYNLLSKWPYNDRILVSPLGIVEEEARANLDRVKIRKKMGLKKDEIAIINSGGVWRWTDINTFFEAFAKFSLKYPKSKLKFFIMGVKQPDNYDHEYYTDQFESLVLKYKELIGDKIFIINDWGKGSILAKEYTFASDIGLNVSLPSLENWQSYRLRFLDYMYYGMPAINTYGDSMSEKSPEALFLAEAQNIESYINLLKNINKNPSAVKAKSVAMKRLAEKYDSRLTYGTAIDHIISTPRRNLGDDSAWGECVLDYSKNRAMIQTKEELRRRIVDLVY